MERYYIGIDVGTGSARACLIGQNGEIVDVASENIGLWQPQQEYYVCLISQTCGECALFYPFYFSEPYAHTSRQFRSNQPQTSGDVSAWQSVARSTKSKSRQLSCTVLGSTQLAP
jgi:ribulose kinase